MASTINIVFRGLLVFNLYQMQGRDIFEIGVLSEPGHHERGHDDPGHVPRIMTFRNGVREDTFLLDQLINEPGVLWDLVVENPVSVGITTREHSKDPINRMTDDTPEDDFRWIIDLENDEFPYGDINTKFGLERAKLKKVVRVSSGEFYTRLKSHRLVRRKNGSVDENFGSVAGVMGCDIAVTSGGAKLIRNNPLTPTVFTFSSDANVMYEFSNSPPDTASSADHFGNYYDIFKTTPPDKFGFPNEVAIGGGGGTIPPGPNPALCGKVFLSQFDGSLIP